MEVRRRDWMIYSQTSGKYFVYTASFLTIKKIASAKVLKIGNMEERIAQHEISFSHQKSVGLFLTRSRIEGRVDTALEIQLDKEKNYWCMVLKRVLSVIRFLASRRLAFRGSNEQFFNSHNGNFLGTLKLLAEYDDFLKVHIAQHGNKNRGHISYVSNTICDEFIEILGEHIRKSIVQEIKDAKYFSIIVDSTSDIENIDQLILVIRYVSANNCPVERFLFFLPNVGHKGEQMGEWENNCSFENFGRLKYRFSKLQRSILRQRCKYVWML
jgi:hypothetical protein